MPFDPTLDVVLGAAVVIAFTHTIIGIDHALPFVVLARARGWSLTKTLGVTAVCGAGHVLSSVVLGAAGVALGMAAGRLADIESFRGDVAAWLLIAFGVVYALRALLRNARQARHAHVHTHADGTVHSHDHGHVDSVHRHPHEQRNATTFWTLFILFVLGPCEPLVPLLMAPAASRDLLSASIVALSFGAVTIGTMLAAVTVGYWGLRGIRFAWLESHADTFAGVAIAVSGLAIVVLGV
jgi:nickel/cobalt exporter